MPTPPPVRVGLIWTWIADPCCRLNQKQISLIESRPKPKSRVNQSMTWGGTVGRACKTHNTTKTMHAHYKHSHQQTEKSHTSGEAQEPPSIAVQPQILTTIRPTIFIHIMPWKWVRLQTKTKARIYPAYHTAYDTFDYASRYIDPGECSHAYITHNHTHQNANNKCIKKC